MNEPDVTLTDYALTLECGLFVYWLLVHGQTDNPLRLWFAVFFASIGVAAFSGGTVHGYFPNADWTHCAVRLDHWRAALFLGERGRLDSVRRCCALRPLLRRRVVRHA